MEDFGYYRECFRELHTNKWKGFMAPHKPLLLLAMIDMVEAGEIRSNRIFLTQSLVDKFNEMVSRYVGKPKIFRPNIGIPFFHMQTEPFWRLVEREDNSSLLAAEQGITLSSKKISYTVNKLRERFECAVIDQALFELLQDVDARAKLRTTLIGTYLTFQQNSITIIAGSILLAASSSVIA